MGTNNYKTIKCRYHELGICKYKDACHFSHGESSIKTPVLFFVLLNIL